MFTFKTIEKNKIIFYHDTNRSVNRDEKKRKTFVEMCLARSDYNNYDEKR
jgi:hypothetical protein